MTAIGTADVATFTIKFDIDAAATAPKIDAYAVKSPNTKLGAITKIKQFERNSSVAGVDEVDNIPKEGRWLAVHHYGKSDIDGVEVQADSNEVLKLSKTLSNKIQRDYGRTPLDTKGTTVDFVLEGTPLTAFSSALHQDVRFRPILGSAGAYTLLVEYFTEFKGI
jgi:hypothetical protein